MKWLECTVATRMHSSRVCTVRCSSCLLGEDVCPGGCRGVGVCLGNVCPGRGCLPREGVSAQRGHVCPGRGCLPRECLPDTPPWTEWLMPVKTLPCRNYVADGKNRIKSELFTNFCTICISSFCTRHTINLNLHPFLCRGWIVPELGYRL